jgi:hypothetical protein
MTEREIGTAKGLETTEVLWMLKLQIPGTFRGMHRTLASRELGARPHEDLYLRDSLGLTERNAL